MDKQVIKTVCVKLVKHADTPSEVRHTKHMLAVALSFACFMPEWMVVPYTVVIGIVQLYKL